MKPEEIIICDFIHDFTQQHWDKIQIDKSGITQTKEDFLEEIKTDFQTAMWMLREVCYNWMDKEYLREIYVNLDSKKDFDVIKINDKYIKITNVKHIYDARFCEPKSKTVYYFD
jgi:hypothetical protein